LLKATQSNLTHTHPYVRRNAVLAIGAIYRTAGDLVPDAPELLEAFLVNVRD
jgi:coatomer subunit beta